MLEIQRSVQQRKPKMCREVLSFIRTGFKKKKHFKNLVRGSNMNVLFMAHTFKTNVFKLSGISSRLQRRTSWISEHRVVSLGLDA